MPKTEVVNFCLPFPPDAARVLRLRMQELKSVRTFYQKCDTEEGITAICNYNPSQFTDALRPSVVLATQIKRSLCFGSSASNSSGLF
jgi:hypothetical protein